MQSISLRYSTAIFLFCIFVCSSFLANNEISQTSHLEKVQQQVIKNACGADSISADLAQHIFEAAPQEFKDIVAIIEEAQRRYATFFDSDYYHAIMPSRILLVGAPGVGKSTLARLMAQLLKRELIFVRAPMLGTEYQNSEIVNLTQIFEAAFTASNRIVLVLDEINILVEPKKNHANDDKSIASALWLLLDKCAEYPHILVVGTCNDASKLPEQLKDRFMGNIIQIPNASEQERFKCLKFCFTQHDIFCDEDVLYFYAKKTQGFSMRQLEAFVALAQRIAFSKRHGHPIIEKDSLDKAWLEFQRNSQVLYSKKARLLACMQEYSYILPYITLGAQALAMVGTIGYYLIFHERLIRFNYN